MWRFFFWVSRHLPFGCKILRLLFSCDIPRKTKIGNNVRFGHKGLGIVVHEDATIEDNVMIQHHVTIGILKQGSGAPIIKEGCFIGPYAMILGGVKIGEHSIIGAGSLVTHDVPPYTKYYDKRTASITSIQENSD